MFPLFTKTLPADPEGLREAIEESLRRVVRPAGPMVSIEGQSYPRLASIRVSLDHATAGDRPPRPPAPAGPVTPALQVETFEISGAPIHLQGAAINLSCRAREVEITQGRDRDGNILLLLKNAAEGSVEIATPMADLEALLRAEAKAAAAQQGVAIEDVRIKLHTRSERSLDVAVQVRAKKLFLSATVRINGRLEIDEQLNARLSGLQCAGDGKLGSLACGFLSPHLQRFNNRAFPLAALPLGGIKLRDVRIAAGTDLRVTAQFGQVPA